MNYIYSQVVIPNLRSYDEPTPKNQPMKEAKQQEGLFEFIYQFIIYSMFGHRVA